MTEAGNSVRIYVSHINFEATYSYLETSSLQLSMIRVYSINSITTQDSEMFNSLKDWIQSLKNVLYHDLREWRDATYPVFQ